MPLTLLELMATPANCAVSTVNFGRKSKYLQGLREGRHYR
jgi:hypothetical protein